ncbi:hypothetical protein [Jatrophihabitans sp.]|uniref:hypothetical protein n=1 Tax=Jatrophihabitans sp. TaxID=1932789 RepID=UPI003F81D54C
MLLLVLVAALTGAAAVAGTASAAPQTSGRTAAATTPGCGGGALRKADGTPWVCSFDDEFGGSTLDRSKWMVETTVSNGYHSGAECFVDSRARSRWRTACST